MDSTYCLTVAIKNTEQKFLFETKRKAMAALKALEGKMGHRYRNDPEGARHRIKSGDGEAVILVDEVSCARVVDQAEFRRLAAYTNSQIVKDAEMVNGTLVNAISQALQQNRPAEAP